MEADRQPAGKPVVTLFEHYGAGAQAVGTKVAEALGLPFHGQAFSSEDIEGGGPDRLAQNATLATVYAAMGGAYGGFDGRDVVATQQDKYDLVMDNNRTVRSYAESGGVIVGRNATVILADRPNTVHVLLTGALVDRVARAAQQAEIPLDRAAARQQREDDVRGEMSKVLYGWDPRLPDRYDMVFNTSRVPIDGVVRAIVETVRALAGPAQV
ncbi:cytidylate kinase-like family protein [Occultella gossypii]|uniref:Cytidylate kinase-like family protein n=1 Tax=Occultella gossypii TaxID=2800820 RepID=A0ABS7S6C2_9MICO|nr:cytidylate kinase-like family protein [Occultella gossypii]MBZ2195888.1 cytidylate kinase-like family protein [Occultella gossypii]